MFQGQVKFGHEKIPCIELLPPRNVAHIHALNSLTPRLKEHPLLTSLPQFSSQNAASNKPPTKKKHHSTHKLKRLYTVSSPPSPTLPFSSLSTHRHNHTRNRHIRTQPLAHARRLPKRRYKVILLVAVDDAGKHVVCVCRRAYREEDDEE